MNNRFHLDMIDPDERRVEVAEILMERGFHSIGRSQLPSG
jgi:hypothetical protein